MWISLVVQIGLRDLNHSHPIWLPLAARKRCLMMRMFARDMGPGFSVAGVPGPLYRGTSLIRKRTPLGPYRRPVRRVLGKAQWGGRFLMGKVPL